MNYELGLKNGKLTQRVILNEALYQTVRGDVKDPMNIRNIRGFFAALRMTQWGRGGFTLIELIVVVAVLVTIGSIVVGTITSSLRGTNKTNLIENIRQNGNYAISRIARSIEFAEAFQGFSDDNFVTLPIMQCPTGQTSYKYIRVKPFHSTPIIYSFAGTPFSIASDSASFINTNTIEVDPSSSFTCTISSPFDVPVIGISFSLKPVGISTLVERSNPPITFETSVVMRNYQR